MAQKIVDRRKRSAPASLVEWIGGSLTTLDGESAVLWVHRGRPVAQRPLAGATAAEALRSLIEGADAERRPTRLRVDAATAEALGAEVAGVAVTAGDVTEVTRLQGMLVDDARLPVAEEPSMTRGGRVPVGVWAGLFESTARMQMIAPWRNLSETDLVQVSCPALGLDGVVASIFDLPEPDDGTRGVACFASAEVFANFRREVETAGEDAHENLPLFVINLLTPRSLAPGLVREIAQHGLPVVEGRAPFLVGTQTKDGGAQASPRQVLQAWAVIEAVNWLGGREADGKTLRFDALVDREASVTFVAPMIPGLPRVEVTPIPAEVVEADDRPPTDSEAHAEEVWLWAEGYFDEQVEKGREKRSLRAFNTLVDMLCSQLEEEGVARLADWDVSDVEALWELVATEVPVSAEELLPGVEDLVAWLRWCEATERFALGEVLAETVLASKDDFAKTQAAAREEGELRTLEAYYGGVFGADEE